jgi:hypothetical protein
MFIRAIEREIVDAELDASVGVDCVIEFFAVFVEL